jgi:hypothetical protein
MLNPLHIAEGNVRDWPPAKSLLQTLHTSNVAVKAQGGMSGDIGNLNP